MRSLIGVLTAMMVLVAVSATSLEAQQVRQRDSTPFERYKPLAALASPSNRETMTQLQRLLTDRGYTIASMDPDRGELLAIKKDAPTSDKSDRVLLWLERDPIKPAERASTSSTAGSNRSSGRPTGRSGCVCGPTRTTG